jgi:tRNA pseudouridine65 synthase
LDWSSFDIIYEDESLVAINKPCHILVHPTKISEDTVFVLPLLEQQLGMRLFPIHRLDRPTSGVLLFAKSSAAAAHLSEQFREQRIEKVYLAIVRGYVEEQAVVDYAIGDHDDKTKPKRDAVTHYIRLAQSEVPYAINKYPQSRFSFVKAMPKTGRRHQIRRHFAHLRHPIIGDKRHGDIKYNKFFLKEQGWNRLFLHAYTLSFLQPDNDQTVYIEAPLNQDFKAALELLMLGEGLKKL